MRACTSGPRGPLVRQRCRKASPRPSVALGYYNTRAHTISNDGSRVFWTASQETPAHLYMRDLTERSTIQLDKAQEGITEPRARRRFQTASGDGSRVFFTDDQGARAGGERRTAAGSQDLYECEITRHRPESVLAAGPDDPAARGRTRRRAGLRARSQRRRSSVYLVARACSHKTKTPR